MALGDELGAFCFIFKNLFKIYEKKYLIICYNHNFKVKEFQKDTFEEIESFLENLQDQITSAFVYLNEEPYTQIGKYIGFPNKMLFDPIYP